MLLLVIWFSGASFLLTCPQKGCLPPNAINSQFPCFTSSRMYIVYIRGLLYVYVGDPCFASNALESHFFRVIWAFCNGEPVTWGLWELRTYNAASAMSATLCTLYHATEEVAADRKIAPEMNYGVSSNHIIHGRPILYFHMSLTVTLILSHSFILPLMKQSTLCPRYHAIAIWSSFAI